MIRSQFIFLFCIPLLIMGCMSSSKLPVESIAVTANPSQEVKKLEQEIEAARADKIDLLAPSWFERAKVSYGKAKVIQENGGEVKELFDYVATARAQLKKGRDFAAISTATLKDVVTARQKAIDAGAGKETAGFTEAEEQYEELNEAVENGYMGWVEKQKGKLATFYLDVELTAIKDKALKLTRAELQRAEDNDTEDYAPRALKTARDIYDQAEKYINVNRYEKEGIAKVANKSLFYAKRANHIARHAKFIKEGEPEEIATWTEGRLYKLSQTFDLDLRDQSVEQQFASLDKKFNETKSFQKDLAGKSQQLASQVELLRRKKEADRELMLRLKSERELNQKYIQAQKLFSSNEAEVYKDGGKLVIRLKGINFPSGKSVLLSRNYPLLGKVKKTLEQFGRAQVLVEGHTDSVGAADVNEKLSAARAQSVSEYLVANNAIGSRDIESKGLGFSRPIATNKTKAGRAQNRRIDIIIEPHKNLGPEVSLKDE